MSHSPGAPTRLLVAVAHPDDESLGCGATIAKYGQSSTVHVATLSPGATSRHATEDTGVEAEIERLRSNARSASLCPAIAASTSHNHAGRRGVLLLLREAAHR